MMETNEATMASEADKAGVDFASLADFDSTPNMEFANFDDPQETDAGQADTDGESSDGEADDQETPTEPETVTIGDAEVPLAEIAANHAELAALREMVGDAELKDVVEAGSTYASLLTEFNSGAEGARAVLSRLVNAYIGAYGSDVKDGEAINLEGLNPEVLEGPSLMLYHTVREAQRQSRELANALTGAHEKLLASESELARFKNADKYVLQIKAKYPEAEVTGDAVLKMMEDTKSDDPVKAYILTNHDMLVSKARGAGHATGKQAKAIKSQPGGGEEIVIDPKTMSISQMTAALERKFGASAPGNDRD